MKIMVHDAEQQNAFATTWLVNDVKTCRRAWKTLHNMGSPSDSGTYSF